MKIQFKKSAPSEEPLHITDRSVLHLSDTELQRQFTHYMRKVKTSSVALPDPIEAERLMTALEWAYYFNRLYCLLREKCGKLAFPCIYRHMLAAPNRQRMQAYLLMKFDMSRPESTPEHYAAAVKLLTEHDYSPDLTQVAKPPEKSLKSKPSAKKLRFK